MPSVQIRPASTSDRSAVAALAADLARSFPFSRAAFDRSYDAIVTDDHADLLVAVVGSDVVGYVLGFVHPTFYANGPVAQVEEIVVHPDRRGLGVGRRLMDAFEDRGRARACVLVALATRRAASFYRALGYEESATHFRKAL